MADSILILFFNQKSFRGAPVNDAGDIVEHVFDESGIGSNILNNPDFVKLTVLGLERKLYTMQHIPLFNNVNLHDPLLDFNGSDIIKLEDRRFRVHFGKSGIVPVVEFQTINIEDLVIVDKAGGTPKTSELRYNVVSGQFEY